jgi:hypothetical protein
MSWVLGLLTLVSAIWVPISVNKIFGDREKMNDDLLIEWKGIVEKLPPSGSALKLS